MSDEDKLELGGQHGWMSRRGFLAGTAAAGLTIVGRNSSRPPRPTPKSASA